jgi:uncharacterized membrane protein YbhN (UPF0104 family)
LNKHRHLSFAFKLTVSLLIFSFLVWKIGFFRIVDNFGQFKIFHALLAVAIFPTTYIVAATGVVLMGRSISRNLEWWKGIEGFLATVSLSIFLPGRLGDLSLPFFWKRYLKYGESLSILLIDKIITIIWVLGLGSCAIYAILHKSMSIIIGTGILSVFAIFVLVFSNKRVRVFCYKFLPRRFYEYYQGFISAIATISQKGKISVLATFVMTGLRMSLYGIIFWILLSGLNIACPLYYPIFILAIAQLVSILPISIMGMGTSELVLVFAFGKINIDASSVITVSLLGRAITMLWLGIFFVLFATKYRFSRSSTFTPNSAAGVGPQKLDNMISFESERKERI